MANSEHPVTDRSLATLTQPTDPPALSDSYQKTHRNYVLISALLAAWELIGIEVETKEKWGIVLKSPQAAPFILLALLIYFGYRLAIEWAQCNPARRAHPAAKLDHRVAHSLGMTAVLILIVQYLLRIQIFDLISKHVSQAAATVVLSGIAFGFFWGVMQYNREKKKDSIFGWAFTGGMLLTSIIAMIQYHAVITYRPYVGWLVSTIVGFPVGRAVQKRFNKYMAALEEENKKLIKQLAALEKNRSSR